MMMMSKPLVALAIAFAMLACGPPPPSVVEVPPDQLPQTPQPTAQVVVVEAAPKPLRAGEQWVGKYVCLQGETDLTLHIDDVAGESVDAVFEFSHSPTGAAGAYKMRGNLTADGQVVLVPGQWMDRPPGYVSVGMRGEVHGQLFAGRIDGPGCTDFRLRRR